MTLGLRGRLVLGLLTVSAVGLVILAAVSYAALRSYLSDRVDEQVDAAIEPAGAALGQRPGCGDLAPIPDGRGRGPSAEPPPGGPPPGGGPQLPPGTYAEIRGAGGEVACRTRFAFGEAGTPSPELPAGPPLSSPADPEVFEVPAAGGASAPFRAVAVPAAGAGTLIVAVPLTELEETLDRLLVIDAAVAGGILVAMALLALWVVRVGLRPLAEIEGAARGIAAGELNRRVETPSERTEVGRLGAAFNEMVARIEDALARREASEERLRRFVADASHELRTPLSSIRGYAELFRIGAVHEPEELEKSLARIESEAARMGTLVDELMTLVRFDEHQQPARRPIELGRLMADAVEDARAAAPRREITLAVTGSTTVLGEERQLRQVLANLLGNALAHTPEGSPVEAEATGDAGHVEVVVSDHGPGIPPGAETAVFERFWRADKARERARGGSGLGLAIVAAIVGAHGGTIEAANRPGGGARFAVRLPTQRQALAGK